MSDLEIQSLFRVFWFNIYYAFNFDQIVLGFTCYILKNSYSYSTTFVTSLYVQACNICLVKKIVNDDM